MQFFDELPERRVPRREPIDWEKAKAELVAHEGEWGLMVQNVSDSTVDQLRAGKYKSFRGEELKHFEFATRKPDNPEEPYAKRRTDVYGKYTSEPVS